jgi:hypothetical protein
MIGEARWHVYSFRGLLQESFDTEAEANDWIAQQAIPEDYYKDKHS